MTKWTPTLEAEAPRYLAIADALARDIAAGRLKAGDRLPTHRDLAWRLGVTVGTVSRVYGEAERRGLTSGEVGRGPRSEEHTSELQSLMRISYAVFCLKKKKQKNIKNTKTDKEQNKTYSIKNNVRTNFI